jgi:hypothetical protein
MLYRPPPLWTPTKKINQYTGKPNIQTFANGVQCVVFHRRWGWSYTTRVEYLDGRWLQLSAGSQQQYPHLEMAQDWALRCTDEINDMVEITLP